MREIVICKTIPFSNPYVLRVEFKNGYSSSGPDPSIYAKIKKKAFKICKESWGFSQLEYESVVDYNLEQTNLLSPDNLSHLLPVLRGYICFKSEEDALQLRLSIDHETLNVKMWPTRDFTIHKLE